MTEFKQQFNGRVASINKSGKIQEGQTEFIQKKPPLTGQREVEADLSHVSFPYKPPKEIAITDKKTVTDETALILPSRSPNKKIKQIPKDNYVPTILLK